MSDYPGKWELRINSWSSSPSGYYYSLTLKENEDLIIDTLIIDGIELRPYFYEEHSDGPGIEVNARVRLSTEENQQLRKLIAAGEYHKVIRRGISDEPREMRFGAPIWSKDGDHVKHKIILIEKILDEIHGFMELDPTGFNVRQQLSYIRGFVKSLSDMLSEKGIISAEEAEKLHEKALEEVADHHIDLYEAEDIDAR